MQTAELQNEALLVAAAKTSETAFTELYDYYFPKIYGFVLKRVGHKEVAEDLVSKTFLKAFSALPTYQDKGCPFGAWLYRIATNNILDHYRAAGRHQEVEIEQAENLENDKTDQMVELDGKIDKQLIGEIIKSLPEKYQQAIHLKFFAELSNQEIALILKESSNNVGVIIYRALKMANKVYVKKCGTKNVLKILIFF